MVFLPKLPIRILLHLLARDDAPRRCAEALVLVSPERGTQEKLFPLVRLSSLEAEGAPMKDPVRLSRIDVELPADQFDQVPGV